MADETRSKIITPGTWHLEVNADGDCINTVYDCSFRELLGYDSEEEYANSFETWVDSVHPDDIQRVQKAFAEVLKKHPEGMEYDVEYRMMTKQQGYHWFHDYGYCTRKEDGTVLRCDGVVFDIQDSVEREKMHHTLSDEFARLLALQDNFEAMYDVDLENGHYVVSIGSEMYKMEIDSKMVNDNNYFDDLKKNIDTVVHPDDRVKVYRLLCKEGITQALSNNYYLDFFYRTVSASGITWYKSRVVYKDEEKKHIVIGVFNAEEELEAKRHEQEQHDELISRMLDADGMFLVDCKNNTVKTIHRKGNGITKVGDEEDYYVGMNYYIDNYVAPADRDKLRELLDARYMLARTMTENEYTLTYRDSTTGVQRFYEMKVTRYSDTEVLQSFKENDKEIVERLIFGKLEEDYFALIGVDLDSGLCEIMKDTRGRLGEIGIIMPYSEVLMRVAPLIGGDAELFLTKISNIDYLKYRFAKEDKATYTYKSNVENNTHWVTITELVLLRHDDGTPSLFALVFDLLDEVSAMKEELRLKADEDMQMISGLADEYHALYYYNIKEQIFKVYSLEASKTPEVMPIVEKYENPVDMIHAFGNSKLVHPDDRSYFRNLTVETVLKGLAHRKKITVRFRRNYSGVYHWTELDIIKYEDIDETPNVIALGFADRDADIQSDRVLSDCFRILNKEIPPGKAIDELLSVAGKFYGAERAYIFEYINNKKEIRNTYEWCATGVEPMIALLQNIPAREVDGWITEFNNHGAFYMDTLDEEAANTEEGRKLLEVQGIERLIAAPILNGEEIVGFIGVDNPTQGVKNIESLKNIAAITYSEILKIAQQQMTIYESAKIFADTFLNSYVSAYYVNLKTFSQVVFHRPAYVQDAYGHIDNYLESITKYIEESVHPEDRQMMLEVVQPSYMRKRLRKEGAFSVYMRDITEKKTHWYRFDVTKGADTDHVGLAFADVTSKMEEDRKQQKQLEEARNQAEIASRSKTQFLFNMSHDIRTPLNAVIGFTNMAKKYVDNREKVTDYLEKIDMSGEQLLSLVNQVLEMARIESGKIELEEVPVNVQEEYNAVVTIFAEQAKTNGLEFHHSLNDVVHYKIFSDQARVGSITLNIVGNAMKYTPHGGRIDFVVKEIAPRKEGYATFVFTVADTGIGMSKEYLKNLFEPFTREKTTTVSKIQGTGLGMSIVRDLVNLMGGNIEVQSTLGKGTTFNITIDFRINDAEHADAADEQIVDAKRFAGCRVLVVEDFELNREIAKDILSDEKMIVEEADDGSAAVKMLKEKGPDYYDFILMDIQMPIMNGYDATRAIRKMYPDADLPIIALSANAFSEDRTESIAAGMNDHVAKPINTTTLFRVIAKYLK